jgi:hypothetical protein
MSWRDDENDQTDGKTAAIIKVTGWLSEIEAAVEEAERLAEEESEEA